MNSEKKKQIRKTHHFPATVEFVIIVIDWIVKTKSPHAISGRRIHQPPMTKDDIYHPREKKIG